MQSRTPARDARLCLLVLALLPLILFPDVFFLGNNFFTRDLARYHYPMKKIVRDTISSGAFPYWNRLYACGQPLAANPAYEVFYPPQWLIFLPDYNLGFRLHILVHLYIAEIGMYALLRSLRLSRKSSLFGAASWAFGGTYLSIVNLLPFFFSTAWLPLIALTVRRFVVAPSRRSFAAAALALGLQALVGEPMTMLQTWSLLALWGVTRAMGRSHRLRRAATNLLRVGAAVAGGICLALVQLVPAFDHARDSVRAAGFTFRTASYWSFPPLRIFELVFPQLLAVDRGFGRYYWSARFYDAGPLVYSFYAGLLAGCIAIALLFTRNSGRGFIALASSVSLLVAFGSYTPLYRLLFQAAIVRDIRYPEKFVIAVAFLVTVWAAVGAERILRGDRTLLRRTLLIAVGATAVAGAMLTATLLPGYTAAFRAFWKTPAWQTPLLASLARYGWSIAVLRGVLLVGVLAMAARMRSSRAVLVAVAAFVALDLGSFANELLPRVQRTFFDPPPLLAAVPLDPERSRILHEVDFDHKPTRWSVLFPELDGYWLTRNGLFPMTPATWGRSIALDLDTDQTYLQPTRDLLNVFLAVRHNADAARVMSSMLGVRYDIVLADFSGMQGHDIRDVIPVAVRSGPPAERYYFADEVIAVRSVRQVGQVLLSRRVSRRVAFVPLPVPIAPARVTSVAETPNAAVVDVDSSGESFLVASITDHRYWRALLDGRRVPIIRTNIALQGVVVPAGRHRITFAYHNPLIVPPLVISALTLLCSLAFLALARGGPLAKLIRR
jgi:Bacterial membrane protein YfhO